MKKLSILITVLIMCFSVQVIGQKAMSRSLRITKTEITKEVTNIEATINKGNTILGAFGEIIKLEAIKEVKETNVPTSKAVVFHKAKLELHFLLRPSL